MTACRCLDHALPPGRALELGPGHGVARQRRPPAEPEAAASAVRYPQVLIMIRSPQHLSVAGLTRATHARIHAVSFCGGRGRSRGARSLNRLSRGTARFAIMPDFVAEALLSSETNKIDVRSPLDGAAV